MANDNFSDSTNMRFWPLLFLLVIVAGGIWWWAQAESASTPETAGADQAPRTEWTTAPHDGVEVDLPDTQMTNAPVETPPEE